MNLCVDSLPAEVLTGDVYVTQENQAQEQIYADIGQKKLMTKNRALASSSDEFKNNSANASSNISTCKIIQNDIPNEEYLQLARSLNTGQMKCFLHVLHHIKTQVKTIVRFSDWRCLGC